MPKLNLKDNNLKQDDRLFLEALQEILEYNRVLLVEELTSKLSTITIASTSTNSTIDRSVRNKTYTEETEFETISIDDSKFVVEQTLDGIEKGFQGLAEKTMTKDSNASATVNKLRNLKKGN